MLCLPMLFDESSTIDVNDGNKVEFGRCEHSLVLFIVLEETLMQQFQTDKERNLHRKEFSGMGGSRNQNSIGSIQITRY